ncbi:MAG: nickel pincer cofactor biosynthesis protein LarC [Clostridiaceae bacterium]
MILYYDCFSGISGDMNLGALLDLGVDKYYLLENLKKLDIDGYSIDIKKDDKQGILATNVSVNCIEEHVHRNYKNIKEIINKSRLNENIKKISIDIFTEVAKAEASVHKKTIDEVHFHEVGALDSIIDIVGAAICFDYLKVEEILSSSVVVGSGFVKCAHGLLSVPAPATSEILKNIPMKPGNIKFEATTPTGAAILASQVSKFSDEKDFIIKSIGYGSGDKIGEIPNVLRAYLGEKDVSKKMYIIETNIDDMNPEILSYVSDELLDIGAMDVYRTPIVMKKGRLGTLLSVLCYENDILKLEDYIFSSTTTIGIREYAVKRKVLDRKIEKIDTEFGLIKVKRSYYKEGKIKSKFEFDDLKVIAKKNNISIYELIEMLKEVKYE